MSLFRAARGWGDENTTPLPKIGRIYLTMMKLGTVIPYQKKKPEKHVNQVAQPFVLPNQYLFTGNHNFCYIKKKEYVYRLHFNT